MISRFDRLMIAVCIIFVLQGCARNTQSIVVNDDNTTPIRTEQEAVALAIELCRAAGYPVMTPPSAVYRQGRAWEVRIQEELSSRLTRDRHSVVVDDSGRLTLQSAPEPLSKAQAISHSEKIAVAAGYSMEKFQLSYVQPFGVQYSGESQNTWLIGFVRQNCARPELEDKFSVFMSNKGDIGLFIGM